MKGLSVFELLAGLDDDMITAATLPETSASAVKPPRRRWRKGALGDFLNNGWVAACVSIVTALAVLAAIITAGQNGEKSDGRENHTLPPPPATDTNGETSDPDADREQETDVDDDPVLYRLKPSTIQIIHQDAPVSITSDGQTVIPKDYLVLHHITHYTELDENGQYREESTEGEGAVPLLDEILDELPHLTTTGESYTVSLSKHWGDDDLQAVRLFEVLPDGTTAEIPLPTTGHPEDEFSYGFPRTPGEYVVVLHTFTVYRLDDTVREIARLEYPFRLTVLPSGADEPDVPFPRITLKTESSQLVYASRADGYASLTPEQLPSLQDQIPAWSVCYGDAITAWRGDREESLTAKIYTLAGETVNSSSPESLSLLSPGQYYVILSAGKPDRSDPSKVTYTYHYYPMLLTVEAIDETLLTNNPQASPAAPSRAYLTVEGGGYMVEFAEEDGHFLYATESDGLSIDGNGARSAMIQNWKKLPVLTVCEGDELTATIRADCETSSDFRVYDVNGQALDYATVPELSEGMYFIIVHVHKQYEYLPEYDTHACAGYEYPFILKIVSPD